MGGGRAPGLLLPVLLLALPSPAAGQLRRAPAVQPAAEAARGDLLIGAGIAFVADARFPLSGLSGDLFAPLRLSLAWAPADRVVLTVDGDVWRVLEVEESAPSAVPLEPGARDGTTGDAGDFRLGVVLAPLGRAEGLSGGLRLEVKLPNSDEGNGIGTNTTDVRLGALGSWRRGRVRLTADAGVAILEAPLEEFEQNDVVAYSAELLYRLPGGRARLALGLDGRASTRGRVPLGTEDLGEARLGAEVAAGRFLLDVRLELGYAGTSPEWGLGAGVAALLGPRAPARP